MTMLERVQNLKDSECVVDVLRRELADNACSRCGKCTFGYEGVTQLTMIFADLAEKKGRSGDLQLVAELCGLMKTQSLCEEGEIIARAVETALTDHRSELEEHAARKACKAGVCKRFMTYHILANLCTGCGDCLDVCEDDAIAGKKRFVHVIDQGECTQCGKCKDACEEDAIVLAGAVKPRCPQRPIPCKAR